MRIKKGDEVSVIAGKDKGRRGVVLSVHPKQGKVLVEGINLKKHYVKANPQAGTRGAIETKESPLPVSNVMLFDKETGKGSRVGFKILSDGRKVRFLKSSGRTIDV